MEWKQNEGYPNQLLSCDEFYISYNPKPGQEFAGFAADNNSSETALKLMGKWYILNGDFRKEYQEVFPDPIKCFAVYEANKKQYRSSWSTDDDGIEDIIHWIEQRTK